jgi:hypothetical protein
VTGRERVEEAWERTGLLWVQGQGELESLADLLAGKPVTTQGYSWDYVPAWELREELAARDDAALTKLVRGRSTLVHARHWPMVQALAIASRRAVVAGERNGGARALLDRIERVPGTTGADLKALLGLQGKDGSRTFQKLKTLLETWLCIEGREQEDAASHTHDALWFPWSEGKIAGAAKGGAWGSIPAVDVAIPSLLAAIVPGTEPSAREVRALLPVTTGLS